MRDACGGRLGVSVHISDAQLHGKTVGDVFIRPTDDLSVGVWWDFLGRYDNLSVDKGFFDGDAEETAMVMMKEGAGAGTPTSDGRKWTLYGEKLSKPLEDFDTDDWEKVRELWLKKWYGRAKEYADKYGGKRPVLYCLEFP